MLQHARQLATRGRRLILNGDEALHRNFAKGESPHPSVFQSSAEIRHPEHRRPRTIHLGGVCQAQIHIHQPLQSCRLIVAQRSAIKRAPVYECPSFLSNCLSFSIHWSIPIAIHGPDRRRVCRHSQADRDRIGLADSAALLPVWELAHCRINSLTWPSGE